MNIEFNFLSMGGFAYYVWSAYGLTTLILLLLWWQSRHE